MKTSIFYEKGQPTTEKLQRLEKEAAEKQLNNDLRKHESNSLSTRNFI